MREAVKREKRIKLKKQYVIFIIIFILSISVLGYKLYERYINLKSNQDIREELDSVVKDVKEEVNLSNENKSPTKIEKLVELQKENSDIKALELFLLCVIYSISFLYI